MMTKTIVSNAGGTKVGRLLMAAVITALFAAGGAHAQPRNGAAQQVPQVLFYEAVQIPADGDTARRRVDVHYRIDREFFIPVKNSEPSIPHPFTRRGELLIELVDSTGTTAGRSLDRIEAGAPDAERKPMGRDWQEGMGSFLLRPGHYRIQITVDDLESKRSIAEKHRTVRVGAIAHRGLSGASAMFIAPPPDPTLPGSLVPVNFGGDVLFGTPSALAIVWALRAGGDSVLTATFSLAETPPAEEDRARLPLLDAVTARVLTDVSLQPSAGGDGVSYRAAHPGPAALAFIPFPTEKLLLRSYALTIALRSGTEQRELTVKFRVVWPDMPFSLKDIDYALEALRYITTEEQLDSLRRGGLESRRKNLEEFWQQRDKTPETAFNDVATEYYRRVDHASRNFGTIRQPDGFRSDRGRIYVLYGPPTATERSLDPDAGYQETWVYSHLNRKFVFVDQNKSGTYILTTTPP